MGFEASSSSWVFDRNISLFSRLRATAQIYVSLMLNKSAKESRRLVRQGTVGGTWFEQISLRRFGPSA